MPREVHFNNYVRTKICASESGKWRDLAVELLNDDYAVTVLDARTQNIRGEKQRCSVMFKFWLEKQPQATWKQLIDALYAIELDSLANDVTYFLIQGQKHIDSKSPKQSKQVEVDQPQNQDDGE